MSSEIFNHLRSVDPKYSEVIRMLIDVFRIASTEAAMQQEEVLTGRAAIILKGIIDQRKNKAELIDIWEKLLKDDVAYRTFLDIVDKIHKAVTKREFNRFEYHDALTNTLKLIKEYLASKPDQNAQEKLAIYEDEWRGLNIRRLTAWSRYQSVVKSLTGSEGATDAYLAVTKLLLCTFSAHAYMQDKEIEVDPEETAAWWQMMAAQELRGYAGSVNDILRNILENEELPLRQLFNHMLAELKIYTDIIIDEGGEPPSFIFVPWLQVIKNSFDAF